MKINLSSIVIEIKSIVGQKLMNAATFAFTRKDINKYNTVLFFLFNSFLRIINMSCFPVVSIANYSKKIKKIKSYDLEIDRIGYSSNVSKYGSSECSKLFEYPLPNIQISEFADAIIHGDSDLIIDLNNRVVINDMCAELEVRAKFFDGILYRLNNSLCIIRTNLRKKRRYFPAAVQISGKFSENYYHSILENLIKLLFIKDIPEEIPVIIDESTINIPSLHAIFNLLMKGSHREIIVLKKKEPILIHRLYYISHVNYILPHVSDASLSKLSDFVFDKHALSLLRTEALSIRSTISTPSYVFISRASTSHRNFNEIDVFNRIKKFGFVKVSPETLTFEEQVTLFNNAKFIVGGTGAAFTNILFCSSGCNIICLQKNTSQVIPCFSTIALLNGCSMIYVGNHGKINDNDIHSDYFINPEDVVGILNSMNCGK